MSADPNIKVGDVVSAHCPRANWLVQGTVVALVQPWVPMPLVFIGKNAHNYRRATGVLRIVIRTAKDRYAIVPAPSRAFHTWIEEAA